MDIGIRAKDTIGAEEEFRLKFPEAEWLLYVLKAVKEYQRRGIQITDVLLREGSYPFFGILKNFFPFPVSINGHILKPTGDQIKNFVKTYLKLENIDNNLLNQVKGKQSIDFSLLFYGKGNLRINFSRDANGVSLNIRVLDFVIPELDTVKYPRRYKGFLKSLVYKSRVKVDEKELEIGAIRQGGLILHAGATGSGKTTCVASELDFFLKNMTGLILTYENPIEYRFLNEPRIRQIELFTHLQPKDIYYHFLRNSPMVGMIGEIKTKEEFMKALDLASRGHLVITTVHANNALEAIYMFLSVIGKEYTPMFLSTIRAVVCHRLLLNKKSQLVPLYEILMPNDVIMKKTEDWEFKALENYLYKDKQADAEAFYSFKDCIEERYNEGQFSIAEKEGLKGEIL